ncbi:UDP-N-acetylglucosamine 1-carboxyvinyltransferase [Candidatus Falkowbacteria bacterium RIFOXYD2_FULL_35_9]|uniref:UDP-N-acetylglucosamine 1-carboxyvinyltransferase n=1 Tax=Candidatus Falkowbacteria bacterium RIFOXYC2_FULL_36_12 TaxID=1798002 RepID=A0A1F5SWU1_9BACT|nr:MAG: UDP-N-acetylglucosamine 1-carboxyvinyltransferase [Candidatus Falkowbacteria bacterium RIFOXYC2_FULL_36_12]OGF31212.1 MAG: UDP-N-acetylglucosamine 1-carboxyvinyltransferase [Candidatus Falkowbacteria bacterium RIFOXYB2_FULL_35_7]OGF32995.1 MAG: UDP-N-acetylglucosamine 1-carboxyvinyltransferase [Candidatus Falkowbacteria bacterium RIFOXYA2_FULL_35_8]OGF47041.1 MAG: UDP-N-acetylglucosamine 1-carboxyvinyltransferase [Candidatus Falkowbacteria bacterium RIFOXYD2_FULL_35_9]
MSKFIITGGKRLSGEIEVMGAKNAALKILAASILSDKKMIVTNVPNIEEINRLLELMEAIGTEVHREGSTLTLQTKEIATTELDPTLVSKIRASVLLVGPLLIRSGEVRMPHPGGCAIGQRPIDLFIEGYKKLGAEIKEDNDGYTFKCKKFKGMTYIFPKISVTVTEALMMAATMAEGTTVLKNAACEPEIQVLAEYLNRVGAKIEGAGTNTIKIEGVKELTADTYEVIPDRIEAGSFAILGALIGDDIKIVNCRPDHLESLWAMFDRMGIDYQLGKDWVQVFGGVKIKAVDVQTHEYPGFVTDLQQPFTVLLTQADGMSLVHETIFEGRLFYTDMLKMMGANIIMCDPHRVIVNGPTKLYGRRLTSPDLRAGFAMVLAGLVAEGTTEIDNIYQIDRGYSQIEKRLQKLGAEIKRVVD